MTVRLKTECPNCKRSLNVTDRHVGKNVRCPACKHQWVIQKVSAGEGPISEGHSDSKQIQTSKSNSELRESKQPARQSGTQNKKLGRFEIIETLGSGSFGVVYKSFDPVLGRSVALKIPKFDSTDVSRTRRFLTEAHAAARLKHPNIVAVYESGEVNSHPFIASEYVEGKPLSQIMKSSTLEFETSARLIRNLAEALAYAHKEGIVHRDIKPDNIMIADKNRPQIMDFGLAKLTDEDSQLTDDGNILGTPAYMSPEQARSRNDLVGPPSDQYSLGVVLFELLTGERPYTGPPLSMLAQVGSEEESPEARILNRDIPGDLSAICHRAMQKDPEKRYANCEEMAEDLSRWLSGTETKARPLSFLEKYRRWYGRNRKVARLWTALGMVLLTLLVIASVDYGWMKFGHDGSTEELNQAINEKLEAQRHLAINEFERGRNFCEEGQLNEGLLWLANSLEKLTPEMSDLDSPIRNYIGSWLPHIHQLEFILPHDEIVQTVSISPDRKLLISGTRSSNLNFNQKYIPVNSTLGKGDVHFWNLETGKKFPESISHEADVFKVLFSPDGSYAVSGSLDKALKIFDPKTGKEIHAPVIHPDGIAWAVFNHDGSILATSCLDEIVRLWKTNDWSLVHEFNLKDSDLQRKHFIKQVAFTPDDKHLMVDINKRDDFPNVRVFDLKNFEEISYHEKFNTPYIAGFTPDGEELILQIEGDLRLLRKWSNPVSPGVMFKKHGDFNNQMLSISRSAGIMPAAGSYNPDTIIYDVLNGKIIGQILKNQKKNTYIDISQDGAIVATGGSDQYVKIWKVSPEKKSGKRLLLQNFPHASFSSKGNLILTVDKVVDHREIRIWNATNLKQELGPLNETHSGSYDFNSNDSLFVTQNWQGAKIFKTSDGKSTHKLSHPQGLVGALFIENDQVLLTGCEDGKLRFWNVETGELMEDPTDHPGKLNGLTVSPDEKYLLTTTDDNQVLIWDLKTRTSISNAISHPKTVWGTWFHPDGEYFATGCLDGTVYFWSVPEGKAVKSPIYNFDTTDGIRIAEFHPDGKQILIGGPSRGVQLWDLETLLPSSRRMKDGQWMRQADLSPDGSKLLTVNFSENRLGEEAQIRNIATQIDGSPSEIKNMLEKTIGLKLTEEGEIRVLDYEEWKSK